MNKTQSRPKKLSKPVSSPRHTPHRHQSKRGTRGIPTATRHLKNKVTCPPATTAFNPSTATSFLPRFSCRHMSSESIPSPSPDSSPEMGSRIKVYTKTGDKGTTTLYNMQRISKTSDYFDALGNTDEVNSTIGLAREYFIQIPAVVAHKAANGGSECGGVDGFVLDKTSQQQSALDSIIDLDLQLQIIQSRLIDIGSCIATPISTSQQNRITRVEFSPQNIDQLEEWIDGFDAHLPPLTVFILPSGGLCASTLHIARTIARRAERSVVPLVERGDCEDVVMKYMNRLSDYFFMAARYASKIAEKPEMTYKKPTPRQIAKAQAEDSEATGLNINGSK